MFNKKKIKELEDKIESLEKWKDDILDKEWREEHPDGLITYSYSDKTFSLFYGKNKFINFCHRNKRVLKTSSKNKGNGRFSLAITYDCTYSSYTYGDIENQYFLVDTNTEMVYNVDSEGRLI